MNRQLLWGRLLTGMLAGLLCTAAQAFEIKAKSENPQFSESDLQAAATRVAGEVGSRIPDDPNIKVFVFSKRIEAKSGQFLYLHRVQLRKAFAGKAPYPYAGFLPIDSRERYGWDNPEGSRAALDECLREFFTKYNSIDPSQPFQ